MCIITIISYFCASILVIRKWRQSSFKYCVRFWAFSSRSVWAMSLAVKYITTSPSLSSSTETVLSLWCGLGLCAGWGAVGWWWTLPTTGGWHQTLVTLSWGILSHECQSHMATSQCRTCSHGCVWTCHWVGCPSMSSWSSAGWSWTWCSEVAYNFELF